MKTGIRLIALALLIGNVSYENLATASPLQQGVGRGPISLPRDPELEKQSMHSLEVARYYFYKRKPAKDDKAGLERLNKAVESRLQEIIDLNPNFGKADEVYFLLGEVYLRGNNLEDAAKSFTRVVKEFPDSQFTGEAKKRIGEIESQGKVKKEG